MELRRADGLPGGLFRRMCKSSDTNRRLIAPIQVSRVNRTIYDAKSAIVHTVLFATILTLILQKTRSELIPRLCFTFVYVIESSDSFLFSLTSSLALFHTPNHATTSE